MKIVKNISGSGRLPSEFVEVFNLNNPYEKLSPIDKMLIDFIDSYNGHYKSEECEWIVEEVDE